MILSGFVLTLLSTAIRLVPPYLTIPLIDDILIPKQHFERVPWYVTGLLITALLAWLPSWMKTYVLATVSEQIVATFAIAPTNIFNDSRWSFLEADEQATSYRA